MKGLLFLFPIILVGVTATMTHNPPYFNLVHFSRIQATSTCGKGQNGETSLPEVYCNLTGLVNAGPNTGCGVCDGASHSGQNAIDGKENTWWQSPSISHGVEYHHVNLTIDLGQEYEVAFVNLKMGNSPRPRVWILEHSFDNGHTFLNWQNYASSTEECKRYFGSKKDLSITNDNDEIICDINHSKIVPLENGEIFFRLPQNQGASQNIRATHIRLRFLSLNTLLGHSVQLSRSDPTVTRRYFYSVKEIDIGGRCVCNGFADSCTQTQTPSRPRPQFLCACQNSSNTCGANCQKCCPGYQGYPNCVKISNKSSSTTTTTVSKNQQPEEVAMERKLHQQILHWALSTTHKILRHVRGSGDDDAEQLNKPTDQFFNFDKMFEDMEMNQDENI